MAVRYYKTDGKRYYVIEVRGYAIPRHVGAPTSGPPGVTYAVLDRDNAHQEMAVFRSGFRRTRESCKREAEALAKELNRREHGVLA